MTFTKKNLGQFFTVNPDVQAVMASLLVNRTGAALEPSSGDGDLVAVLEQFPYARIDAVELDPTKGGKSKTSPTYQDFFLFASQALEAGRSYDVIFGNPPYVPWKSVEPETVENAASVKAAYTDKVNLSVLFMDRALDLLAPGGEIVFIVPKEWFFATAAAPLRAKFATGGSFSHLIDCGEEKLFADASIPSLLIFRWVKGTKSSPCLFAPDLAVAKAGRYQTKTLSTTTAGLFCLLSPDLAADIAGWRTLCEQYAPKVGLVSAADAVFKLGDGVQIETELVQYQVDTTRARARFLNANHIEAWADMPPQAAQYLLSHKPELLARKIAVFSEANWWKYGAVRNQEIMKTATARFYVLAKTRRADPAFVGSPCESFTGALLALFARPEALIPIEAAVKLFNSPRYREILAGMMLIAGGRLSLHQATLEELPFPRQEAELRRFLAR